MYQKNKTLTQRFWSIAIIVVAAICIAGVANAQSKQSDIVGMWEGSYGHGMRLTLIVYDDMKGETSWSQLSITASHTVLAEYSDDSYNVIGEKWINRPNGNLGLNFATLKGVIKNDVFSGKNFQLKRIATAEQVQEQRVERERQIAEREKQQQTQQIKKNIVTIIIAVILSVFFFMLPKELQKAILKAIRIIAVICLAIVTFGVFKGFNTWKNDR